MFVDVIYRIFLGSRQSPAWPDFSVHIKEVRKVVGILQGFGVELFLESTVVQLAREIHAAFTLLIRAAEPISV